MYTVTCACILVVVEWIRVVRVDSVRFYWDLFILRGNARILLFDTSDSCRWIVPTLEIRLLVLVKSCHLPLSSCYIWFRLLLVCSVLFFAISSLSASRSYINNWLYGRNTLLIPMSTYVILSVFLDKRPQSSRFRQIELEKSEAIAHIHSSSESYMLMQRIVHV